MVIGRSETLYPGQYSNPRSELTFVRAQCFTNFDTKAFCTLRNNNWIHRSHIWEITDVAHPRPGSFGSHGHRIDFCESVVLYQFCYKKLLFTKVQNAFVGKLVNHYVLTQCQRGKHHKPNWNERPNTVVSSFTLKTGASETELLLDIYIYTHTHLLLTLYGHIHWNLSSCSP